MLGVDKPGSQVTLSSTDVLHSGKTLLGSLFGGLKPKSDIPILLKRYTDKVMYILFIYFFGSEVMYFYLLNFYMLPCF